MICLIFDYWYIFQNKVSYLIVDEADEDLEMAEDPFIEAGIPELPSYPSPHANSIPTKPIGEDNISIAISKASEVPLEIGQNSQKEKYLKDENNGDVH